VSKGTPNVSKGTPNVSKGTPNVSKGTPNDQKGAPKASLGAPKALMGIPKAHFGKVKTSKTVTKPLGYAKKGIKGYFQPRKAWENGGGGASIGAKPSCAPPNSSADAILLVYLIGSAFKDCVPVGSEHRY
jgi:hypothetical protein